MTAALAAALHGVFEWAGIFVGARIYLRTSHTSLAELGATRNYAVIFGCIVGAAIGNKAMHWLQRADQWNLLRENPWLFLQGQSIVGGLLGGLIGVEIAKHCVGVRESTGDRFVTPILVGLIIGRVGCLIAGLQDDTYGIPTTLPWGIDLGDGVPRHPTAIYDMLFATAMLLALHRWRAQLAPRTGATIQAHAGGLSRLASWSIDALKPVPYAYVGGLSGIQLVSALALVAYLPLVVRQFARLRNMTRKVRPYLFYDTTSARVHPAACAWSRPRSCSRTQNVFMDKWCPAHGTERVLMADDADYYRPCREVYIKPPEMPRALQYEDAIRLPVRLRPVSRSHAALLPHAGRDHRPLQPALPGVLRGVRTGAPVAQAARRTCSRMLDAVVANEGDARRRADLRRRADAASGFLRDPRRGARPADPPPDGQHQRHPHRAAIRTSPRGSPSTGRASRSTCSSIRFEPDGAQGTCAAPTSRASTSRRIERLNELDISTTLVVTLKKGLNDAEIGRIIDFGLAQPCVRGVTLQPIQDAGRVEQYDAEAPSPDGERNPAAHRRTDARHSRSATSFRCPAIPTRWPWVMRSRWAAPRCRSRA